MFAVSKTDQLVGAGAQVAGDWLGLPSYVRPLVREGGRQAYRSVQNMAFRSNYNAHQAVRDMWPPWPFNSPRSRGYAPSIGPAFVNRSRLSNVTVPTRNLGFKGLKSKRTGSAVVAQSAAGGAGRLNLTKNVVARPSAATMRALRKEQKGAIGLPLYKVPGQAKDPVFVDFKMSAPWTIAGLGSTVAGRVVWPALNTSYLNSVSDPAGSHVMASKPQPVGWDEMKALYPLWHVMKAKITFRGSLSHALVVGYPVPEIACGDFLVKADQTNSTSYPVDLQDIARCDYVRRCGVRVAPGPGMNSAATSFYASSPVSCSFTYDMPKFFGLSPEEYISQEAFATKGSCHSGGEDNPTNFCYVNFGYLSDWAKGNNSSTSTHFHGEVIYELFCVGHGFSDAVDS